MLVLISNEQEKTEINTDEIVKIATQIMKAEDLPENSELSLVFCDDESIKELNAQFRDKNEPTDVLSFPMPQNNFENFIPESVLLGDVVISVETAMKQAQDLKHDLLSEIVFLLIHGILHLSGYDHIEDNDRNEMLKKEMEIYKKVYLKESAIEIDGKLSTVIGRAEFLF